MASDVYFIPASRSESAGQIAEKTVKLFQCLQLEPAIDRHSFVALKIHFGERGNTGYIKPAWLGGLVQRLKTRSARVFLTDTNTLYLGDRSNAVEHFQLAWGHGFNQATLGIPVIIADGLIGRDDAEVAINLPRVKSAKVAGAFLNTDMLICLSHFTGHILTGFGAAIKNLGMGCASRAGKLEQHSEVHPFINSKNCTLCGACLEICPEAAIIEKSSAAEIVEEKCIGCGECMVVCPAGAVRWHWDDDKARVQEKMTEYAYAVQSLFSNKRGYFNFLLKMTKDCDCMCKDAPAILDDIGLVASRDPVAVDKASIDLVVEHAGYDIARRYHDIDGSVQLRHGERIGLGTGDYRLIETE